MNPHTVEGVINGTYGSFVQQTLSQLNSSVYNNTLAELYMQSYPDELKDECMFQHALTINIVKNRRRACLPFIMKIRSKYSLYIKFLEEKRAQLFAKGGVKLQPILHEGGVGMLCLQMYSIECDIDFTKLADNADLLMRNATKKMMDDAGKKYSLPVRLLVGQNSHYYM